MPDLDLVALALLAGAAVTTSALAALHRLRQRRAVPVDKPVDNLIVKRNQSDR